MKDICTGCSNYILANTCSQPIVKDGDTYHEWSKIDETRKSETECDKLIKKTLKEVIEDSTVAHWYYRSRNFVDDVYANIKFGVVLKMKHGIDIRDTWSLGHSTCKYMEPRLEYFISHYRHGVPGHFFNEKEVKKLKIGKYFPFKIKDIKFADSTGESDEIEIFEEAWINVLKTIQYAVKAEAFSDIEYSYEHKKVEEGFRLLGIFIQHLWD